MNVRVEADRFLSVACEPDERIVFDRKETKYHLLRDSAARLWDEICEGGTFEVASNPAESPDPVALLIEAGLVGLDDAISGEGITRRVWLRRTGKVSAAAVVLPLVASISAPRLALGQTTDGPSLEEEPLEQIQTSSAKEDPIEQNFPQSRSRRTERKGGGGPSTTQPTGNSDGENGRRTRTRTRTGQQGSGTPQTTESTTRTRRRDR